MALAVFLVSAVAAGCCCDPVGMLSACALLGTGGCTSLSQQVNATNAYPLTSGEAAAPAPTRLTAMPY